MAQPEKMYQSSNKLQMTHKVKDIKALHDHIIVSEMDFSGRQLSTGIILLNDDGKSTGIRPRWAKVWAVGPTQQDVKVGQWIMVEHGRWTRGFKIELNGQEIVLRRADPTGVIFVSDTKPTDDDTISTAVDGQAKTRD